MDWMYLLRVKLVLKCFLQTAPKKARLKKQVRAPKRLESMKKALILFDGVCNLCNTTVQFVLKRDHAELFQFSALQTDQAKKILREAGIETQALNSIVLVSEEGQVYTKSEAALRIGMRLGGMWGLLRIFLLVPAFVRDGVYRIVARNRYRWFGQKESCMIPSAEWKDRFLG
jgi:predicted DCC family thiol-disulfide oxidoreductase YuxK